MNINLALILPCYNEEEVLLDSYNKIKIYWSKLKDKSLLSNDSRIILIDDGSKDTTWEIINSLSQTDESIIGIKLSRNFGHQNALLAGLSEVKDMFDCYITLDIDLQDDINTIEQMLIKYKEECAIVYGVRNNRNNDSTFKKYTAQIFYKIMQGLGVPTVYNHADYRLVSNAALNEFFHYSEVNLFLRGIFPEIGFKTDVVYYTRLKREAGESKYPFKKMITFAWQGVTSFSSIPLKIILRLGVFMFLMSLVRKHAVWHVQ